MSETQSPFIILLNGSINAGKTTVAQCLCRLLPRTAHVEVDDLNAFIDWMPLEESIPLNLRNAAAVARTFLDYGLNVVVSYPLRPEDYEFMSEALEAYPLYTFTLAPPLEVARRNRGSRELTPWEHERVGVHYREGIASPQFGVTLDNGAETPEETAQRILEQIKREAR